MIQREALAKELFALFTDRMATAGLKPRDPEIAQILASMLAAHYVACGLSRKAFSRILDDIHRCCDEADQLAAQRRKKP